MGAARPPPGTLTFPAGASGRPGLPMAPSGRLGRLNASAPAWEHRPGPASYVLMSPSSSAPVVFPE